MRKVLILLVLLTGCQGCASLQTRTPLVAIASRADNNLHFLYDVVQVRAGVEVAYCLYGTTHGDTLHINSLELSYIDRVNHTEVYHNPTSCEGEGFLGKGHTHPPDAVCDLSDTDWMNFKHNQYRYDFLYCSGHRLRIYDRGSIREHFRLLAGVIK